MHHPGDHISPWIHLGALLFVALLAGGYVGAVILRRSSLPRWPVMRTVFFIGGCTLLAAALLPGTAQWAATDLRGHMVQHLLIGMAAPLALVLGAPITLVLGSVRPRVGRRITTVLKTPVVRFVTRLWFAVLVSAAPMAALYFTALYEVSMASPWGHALLHVHFLAAGYLFAWVIAGVDPAPQRASVGWRIFTIGVAVVVHAVTSQLLYAGIGVRVDAPVEEIRDAATLMYYGGDLIEIMLALALLSQWLRPARGLVMAVDSESVTV